MNTYDEEFLLTINEYYPFERYIVKEPQSINNLFDDVYLTELFVPDTEMDKSYAGTGECYLNKDEIYVKIKTKTGEEMRFSYFDFSSSVRETMRSIIVEDMGNYEFQSLYMDYEDEDDYTDLAEMLNEQKRLITEKYGLCQIKDGSKNDELIIKLIH